MEVEVAKVEAGIWRASVWPGRADHLLAALDPGGAFVLIETWDGRSGWHEVAVSVGPDDQPRTRVVRGHRFDLLVPPTEAAEIGRHLHAQGVAGGGLGCYQFTTQPNVDFRLPDHPRGRADAMRGQSMLLVIELPHDGGVAMVESPDKAVLNKFISRLTQPD